VDLKALGERQIKIDCDVLQADGGTRTAGITGAYIALHLACCHLVKQKLLRALPLKAQVAAVSVGLLGDRAALDLDYKEDSSANVDANFVFASDTRLIEIQACGEGRAFHQKEFETLMDLARDGAQQLFDVQQKALGLGSAA
jgi:ribonuclease PH